MSERRFDWHQAKERGNRRKHDVSFVEAATVFDDANRVLEFDVEHDDEEERWSVIGLSDRFRLLFVVFTERDETIRLISARRANQAETRRYASEN